jgi:hypothetical protein
MDPVELDQLVAFRDDEDTRKFYVMPDQPVIPMDDEGMPEFLFIKYIKDVEMAREEQDVGGGWVQFRSVLSITPERRQRVVEALRARLEAEKTAGYRPFGRAIESTEPLLAAPLWIDGRVTLSTLKAGDTGLVRHATESVAADLAGDLGASFGVELSPDGAEIFWGAFKKGGEQQIPILIAYQLTYKARVSAKMVIKASREVMHRKVWQHARPYRLLTAPFARYVPVAFAGALDSRSLTALRTQLRVPVAAMIERAELQQAVRETIDNKEITVTIETDQAGGGEDADKVQEMLFKVATDVLSDRVIPTMFGDAAQPGAGSEQDARASKALMELGDDVGQTGQSSFDLVLDSQSTIERTVNPNGPIHLLLASPQALASCFRELRLSDGFFSLMKVTATPVGVNFERDGIDSIHVFLRYEEQDEGHPERAWIRRAHDGLLRSEKDAIYWRFDTARDARGGHKRAYQYRTEVFYREGGPPSSTDWTTRSDRMLSITPRAMGALRVELALTARKEMVESARVVLRHESWKGTRFETALELTPDANKRTWFQYTGDLARPGTEQESPEYSYQVTYRLGTAEIAMPWATSSAQTLEIPSPFTKVLTCNVRPQGSFEGVSHLSGDITYEDPRYRYRITKSFQLEKLAASFAFVVPILPGGPEEVHWTARLNRADGSAQELESGRGSQGTVWIGTDLSISVLPDLIDFEHDVQLAVVQLSYRDPAHGVAESRTFTFSKSARAPQTWSVDRRDPARGQYDADIRYVAYDRSKSSEVHLRQIADKVLLLDRVAPAA